MREFWEFVIQTAAVAKVIDTAKSIVTRKVAMIAGVVLAVAALVGAAFLVGRSSSTPGATATTPRQTAPVGGVDLAAYCTSVGHDTNSELSCFSKIDLDQACNWEYDRRDLRIRWTSKDPTSGICHDPRADKDLGGISNMSGFCKSRFGRTNVEAAVPEGIWLCLEPINMDLACQHKHRMPELVGRRDANGIWHCYRD